MSLDEPGNTCESGMCRLDGNEKTKGRVPRFLSYLLAALLGGIASSLILSTFEMFGSPNWLTLVISAAAFVAVIIVVAILNGEVKVP